MFSLNGIPFVLGFTVASLNNGHGTISFDNGARANLNTGDTPTTVTATDEDGNVYTDRVLVSMKYTTTDIGDVVEYTESAETFDTAEEFVAAAAGRDIYFVTKGSRAQSQNAYH